MRHRESRPDRRTPVVVACGLDPTDLVLAGISIQWALPRPVVVRHELDFERSALRRLVSDATGLLEDVWVPLDHLCMTCAVRHEIVPTLVRLAERGEWQSMVVSLPSTVPALPITKILEHGDGPGSRIQDLVETRSVLSVVRGQTLVHDLLGDDLLCERNPSLQHDRRAVGEVLAEQVEFADLVVAVDETLGDQASALLRELVRPDAELVCGAPALDESRLLLAPRDPAGARRWVDPCRRTPSSVPDVVPGGVPDTAVRDVSRVPDSEFWSLFLDTWKPLHPTRLWENIEVLGGGPLRGRGCFWLPTRPGATAIWDGAGGQLSVGTHAAPGHPRPRTRLVITGMGDRRDRVREALQDTLVTDAELAAGRSGWSIGEDGFEAWLGDYPASA